MTHMRAIMCVLSDEMFVPSYVCLHMCRSYMRALIFVSMIWLFSFSEECLGSLAGTVCGFVGVLLVREVSRTSGSPKAQGPSGLLRV